jgi:glycosyltransferase involved in cell wall biosynthesis
VNILFITAGFPSPIGQIHVYNLLKVLCRSHYVSVVCFDIGPSGERVWEEPIRISGEVVRVPLPRRLLILRPVAIWTFKCEQMSEAIKTVCRRREYDIAIFEQLALSQYYAATKDIRRVFFPVDAVSRLKAQRIFLSRNPFARLAYSVDYVMTKRYEREVYAKCEGVIFVSGVDSGYTIGQKLADAEKVYVLPNGLDIEYFHPRGDSSPEEAALVFVGNMTNFTNEHAVLWFYRHVWPGVKARIKDVKLYVVGNGPSSRIKHLTRGDSDIIVTGYVKDFRPYVWGASIFVSPLQIGTGIKNRMLQAMAMGKAIVASPLSVEGIDLEAGRHCVVAEGAEEFREEIVSLLRNEELRMEMGKRVRAFIEERHSLQEAGDRFMNIVRAVTKRQD